MSHAFSTDFRLTRPVLGSIILSIIAAACFSTANAARPDDPNADVDFAGSGIVAQAGMSIPITGMMPSGPYPGVMQMGGMQNPGGIQQVGFNGQSAIGGPGWLNHGCASCDGMGCENCSTGGACSSCGTNCGGSCSGGPGGLLGRLMSRGNGCNSCGGMGCGACSVSGPSTFEALQYHLGSINPLGALGLLRPYCDAGIGAQRWYDFSAETLFLGRTTKSAVAGGIITRLGSGSGGTPVITSDQVVNGDMEAGMRLSAALVFGPGGNLEVTYMGGQEWDGSRTATSPAVFSGSTLTGGANLYSFITNFGTAPSTGFDDVDRSIIQTATSSADFHSGEFNYRRRTMGPYNRFQGSWLFGLRTYRYDNGLGLSMTGQNDNGSGGNLPGSLRFFNGSERVKNKMFGFQVGGDLWWNMYPGINLGIELKGAWLKNEIEGYSDYTANSIAAGGPGAYKGRSREHDGIFAGEFQTKLAYRISHSWTLRSAYYAIVIDDVATAQWDASFIQTSVAAGGTGASPSFRKDAVVFQGASFGAEYIW